MQRRRRMRRRHGASTSRVRACDEECQDFRARLSERTAQRSIASVQSRTPHTPIFRTASRRESPLSWTPRRRPRPALNVNPGAARFRLVLSLHSRGYYKEAAPC